MVVHDVCITLASYSERPGYEASIMHTSNCTYSPGQEVGVISKVTPGIGSGSNTIRWEISCRRKYCSNLGNTWDMYNLIASYTHALPKTELKLK